MLKCAVMQYAMCYQRVVCVAVGVAVCVAECVAVTSKRGASGTRIIWLRLCVCCVLQYMLQYVLQ